MPHSIHNMADRFLGYGEFLSSELYGSGHINDTYRVTYDQGGTIVRYIHQRVNHAVFRDPVSLMDNIIRVTDHIRSKLMDEGAEQISRKTLMVVPTHDGKSYYVDDDGSFWRTYVFIEGARTYDAVQTVEQAREAAFAFGQFQNYLVDLPAPRLRETIPNFHHTPMRFEAFEKVLEADCRNRAGKVKKEIDFLMAHRDMTSVVVDLMAQGELPERITHNDTKFNNVMLDDKTNKAICVVDLDTVMPGSVLYDFGDVVRTTTCRALEDERDLSRVNMELPMFEALIRGYLAATGGFLCAKERELLPFSGMLITLTLALRFFTDHLQGDTYFKVHREGHNLDRARTQIKLIESMEEQEDAMHRVLEEAS